MSNDKMQYKTIILNGSKVWLTCMMFVVVHGGIGVWWASRIDSNVAVMLKNQEVIIQKVSELDKVTTKNTTNIDGLLRREVTHERQDK